MTASRKALAGKVVTWAIVLGVLVALPFLLPKFRVEQLTTWLAIAIGACGLNLLTGYNGQISVGHGAFYGTGAYAVAILISKAGWPVVPSVVAAAVICFVFGVVVGLPALRIKGLYLALVTLAVAVLFPLAIEQFPNLTGGGGGLAITTPQEYRGQIVDRKIVLSSPISGLEPDQWKYLVFLAVTVVCFVLTRNLVKSRIGRSLVAIRDNEVAASVSGVPVSAVKVITFGLSSALAGIGGALFALNTQQVNPSSFTLLASIYFLVAVVVGGAASIVGPAIGAAFYGLFTDFISPELPERVKPATPVILGAVLVALMFFAPGGVVGMYRKLQAKRAVRRMSRAATPSSGSADPDLPPALAGS